MRKSQTVKEMEMEGGKSREREARRKLVKCYLQQLHSGILTHIDCAIVSKCEMMMMMMITGTVS